MKHAVLTVWHAADTLRKKAARRVLHWRLRNRPESEILQAERRLRGREQMQRLRAADVVIVSFGKSGRTWLRVMISHFYRVRHDLPGRGLIGFDNFHHMNRNVPRIFFTHDNYIKDVTDEPGSKRPFHDKPVILMARDPRDVAVSQFFQWKFRLKPGKVALNDYPSRDGETSLFEFVTGGNGGGSLQAVVEYLNAWAAEAEHVKRFLLLRYEDLRADPAGELRRVMDFIGCDAEPSQIEAAVEYASYDNMKKMEGGGQFRLAGGRMQPRDRDNPDSYKVRRGKVGGYRDYFSDEEVATIDRLLEQSLDPVYGYTSRD